MLYQFLTILFLKLSIREYPENISISSHERRSFVEQKILPGMTIYVSFISYIRIELLISGIKLNIQYKIE